MLHGLVRSHASIDLNYPLPPARMLIKQSSNFSSGVACALLFDLDLRADFRPDAHLLKAFPRATRLARAEIRSFVRPSRFLTGFSALSLKVSCWEPLNPNWRLRFVALFAQNLGSAALLVKAAPAL